MTTVSLLECISVYETLTDKHGSSKQVILNEEGKCFGLVADSVSNVVAFDEIPGNQRRAWGAPNECKSEFVVFCFMYFSFESLLYQQLVLLATLTTVGRDMAVTCFLLKSTLSKRLKRYHYV